MKKLLITTAMVAMVLISIEKQSQAAEFSFPISVYDQKITALETQSDISAFDETGELSSSLEVQILNLRTAHKISFELAFEILDRASKNTLGAEI